MIELDGVFKTYTTVRGRQVALENVSLRVEAGEFVAICGHSGSGKSTLLGILGGLCQMTGGKVRVEGVVLQELNPQELADFRSRQIGFIFQFPSLLHNLRAIDNVALPALIRGGVESATAYDRAHNTLAEVGLADRWDAYPAELSGGQQRRVAIARALINSPPLLLADEPTSDLDVEQELEIIGLLLDLQKARGSTLILVTHNQALTEHASRVVHLHQGRIVKDLKPALTTDKPERTAVMPFSTDDATVPALPPPVEAPAPLGAGFGRFLLDFTGWVVAAAIGIGLVNYATRVWQGKQLTAREETRKAIEDIALQKLRADVEDVEPTADGGFRLSVYLQNQGTTGPIFVMGPALRAFVQVAGAWQAVPMTAVDGRENEVHRIDTKTSFKFNFRADPKEFDELLKGYMHVRITNSMIVAEKAEPGDDLFDRTDDYYFYLRSPHLSEDQVREANKWKPGGIVPRWIPMPAH